MNKLTLIEADIAKVPVRVFKRKLKLQLLPCTTAGQNLHTLLSPEKWDIIRRKVYKESCYSCDICGYPEKLECHEVWSFNISKRTQRLIRLQALCTYCHAVVHGRDTTIDGEIIDAPAHYCKANKCTSRILKADFTAAVKRRLILEHIPSHKWKLQMDHIVKKYLGDNVVA